MPSSTLGNSSSSPSTLFVSSDCTCITIYQAVFDARTLLQDSKNSISLTSIASKSNNPNSKVNSTDIKKLISMASTSSTYSNTTDIPFDSFNVVSIQSTARPGCIIELDKVADSYENWFKADLFHVYQESLIRSSTETGGKSMHQQSSKSSLPPQSTFNESYFLVLLEKKKIIENGATKYVEIIHMWKITISSSHVSIIEDPLLAQQQQQQANFLKNRLTISSDRVCRQQLNLPDDVYVVCANSAAADLSSSSNNFTLSQVPYLFSTACSDGKVRFWSCKEARKDMNVSSCSLSATNYEENFFFYEWELNLSKVSSISTSLNATTDTMATSRKSQVDIKNYPLAISCSYNGRFAVAFKKNAK